MKPAQFNKLLGLISQTRLRKSSNRGELIESESDKARVINSASFRRLQQKAQVFPLDPNAAVRTRMTHSIEVSQVGRHLAQKIIGDQKGHYQRLSAFVNTVETACLLHDIGNPPFGHLGESAIREWFRENSVPIDDLLEFDGNPQGYRLIAFLAGEDTFGLNLTATQLLSTVKYPWGAENKGSAKKIGLFDSDMPSYEEACGIVEWEPGRAFPVMQIMDVADEIAYSMSDLEDGIEKKIISREDLEKVFGKRRFLNKGKPSFLFFKVGVINEAVSLAADTFCSNIDAILEGEKPELIDAASEVGELLQKVKTFAGKRIYTDESAEQVELAGRSVIKGLLGHFGPLLALTSKDFRALIRGDQKAIRAGGYDFHARLLRRLPESYCIKYSSAIHGDEAYRRAHLLVDFISGMTDDFALETYQILEGIRIK